MQSGAGGANPTQEASRSTNADGSVTIRTAGGGTVSAPAGTPVAGGSATGADTGIVGASGQQVVRSAQGQLAPGTTLATPAAPVSALTEMAAGMPTLPKPNFGVVPTSPQNFQGPSTRGFDPSGFNLNTGATTPSLAGTATNALTHAASKPIGTSVPVMTSDDFAVPRAGAAPTQEQAALAAVDTAGTPSFTPPTAPGSAFRALADAFTTGATNATTQPVTAPLP